MNIWGKLLRSILAVSITSTIVFNAIIINSRGENSFSEYYYNRNTHNKIALTFDDGPHPVYTQRILDILERYNIKATFFIVGENAGYYKETLKKISENGHELGNHTYSHLIIKDRDATELISEIENCRNTIYEICGENTILFRPPGGVLSDVGADDAEIFENYNVIMWSIDTKDWAHHTSQEISEYVIRNTKAGDIILMHDYISQDSPTPSALEIIIPELINKGFEFVTVSDLISS